MIVWAVLIPLLVGYGVLLAYSHWKRANEHWLSRLLNRLSRLECQGEPPEARTVKVASSIAVQLAAREVKPDKVEAGPEGQIVFTFKRSNRSARIEVDGPCAPILVETNLNGVSGSAEIAVSIEYAVFSVSKFLSEEEAR